VRKRGSLELTALTGIRVRLSEMDFSGRLVKIEEEEDKEKKSFTANIISKFRN
jgi:hypothetical protein